MFSNPVPVRNCTFWYMTDKDKNITFAHRFENLFKTLKNGK